MWELFELDLYNDASVVQKGTPDEQRALRDRLLAQFADGSVYGESRIEGLWYKLGKINLGDTKVRTELSKFITEERETKGSDIGAELEGKFKTFERNIALADSMGNQMKMERSGIFEASSSALQALMSEQIGSKPEPIVSAAKPEKTKDTYHEDLKSLNQLLSAWKMATRQANLADSPAEREIHAESIAKAKDSLVSAIADFQGKYVDGKSDEYAVQNGEYVKSINNGIALYLIGKGRIENTHFQDPDSAKAILEENIWMPVGGAEGIGRINPEIITPQQAISLNQLKELYGIA